MVSLSNTETRISALALFGLSYGFLCGGPFGIESAVGAEGGIASIIGLIIFGIFWGLPQTLVAAELTAAFPESGSVVTWLETGLDRRWAAVGVGCFVFSQIFDLAIYSGQIVAYAGGLYPTFIAGSPAAVVFQCCIVLCVGAANLLGLTVITKVVILMLFITLTPFILIPLIASSRAMQFNWDAVTVIPAPTPLRIANLCSVLLWTFQGMFNVASCANLVHNPSVIYPRVLLAVTFCLVCTYAIPIAYGVALYSNIDEWSSGTFTDVANSVSPFLGDWVIIGAALANLIGGLCGTQLYALLIARLAESQLLPLGKVVDQELARKTDEGIPRAAIALLTLTTMGLQFLDFTQIVAIDTALNLVGFFLVSISYLRLRIIAPDLDRPYRVPGGQQGAFLIGGCCVIFALFAFAIVCWGEWFSSIITVIVVLLLYAIAGYTQVGVAGTKHDDDNVDDNSELYVMLAGQNSL
jgi:amino acid transporter